MTTIHTAQVNDDYMIEIVSKYVTKEVEEKRIYYSLDVHDYMCPVNTHCHVCPIKKICEQDDGSCNTLLLKYFPQMAESNPEFFI